MNVLSSCKYKSEGEASDGKRFCLAATYGAFWVDSRRPVFEGDPVARPDTKNLPKDLVARLNGKAFSLDMPIPAKIYRTLDNMGVLCSISRSGGEMSVLLPDVSVPTPTRYSSWMEWLS